MAATQLGFNTTSETFGTTSPVSGDAPTSDLEDGLSLNELSGVCVVLRCPAGQTLSGAGSMACYLLDSLVGAWARFPSGDLSVSTSGVQVLALEALDVVAGRAGRVKWVPVGVTFSGGATGLESFTLGQDRKGGMQP